MSENSDKTSPSQSEPRRRGYRGVLSLSKGWLFYGVIPLVIVAAVSFSLFQTVRSTPSRERAVQLGTAGQVLVNPSTSSGRYIQLAQPVVQ